MMFKAINTFIFTLLFIVVTPPKAKESFQNLKEIYLYLNKKIKTEKFLTLQHDLNDDAIKDFFIALNCKSTKPCLYFLFISEKAKFVERGSLLLAENHFEILNRAHHGLKDILYYQEKGDDQGTIARYQFNGEQYDSHISFTGNYRIKTLIDTKN